MNGNVVLLKVPNKPKPVLLLLTQNAEEKGNNQRTFIGYELTNKGIGFKNDHENKACPNGKDIPRVSMEKSQKMSYAVSSCEKPIVTLVVVEKYIKNVQFLAYTGMRIPLFMISEMDIQHGMEAAFRISQLEWNLLQIQRKECNFERHEVFDNYQMLSAK